VFATLYDTLTQTAKILRLLIADTLTVATQALEGQ
jgi:hypothetical protein